jgi:DNA-binding LacI/PurR family transcriptional regulator
MRDVADRAGVSRQLASLVLRQQPGPSEASRRRVLAAATTLSRDSRPTAVACCSDHCAAGLLLTLGHAGVAVPSDVSVGYDDSNIASLSYLQLTTVHQDATLTVSATVNAILRRLADLSAAPQEVTTPAPLVLRSSTGPVRIDV